MRDYYKILGLKETASGEEIHTRWIELMRKFHPDRRRKRGAQDERIREINEAYEVLKHSSARAHYDLQRAYYRKKRNLRLQRLILPAVILFIFLFFALIYFQKPEVSPPPESTVASARISITTAPTAKLDTNALNVPNDLNDINDLNVINEHNDINDVNPIASRPSPIAKLDTNDPNVPNDINALNDLNDTNDINDPNHPNDLNVLNQTDQKNHSSVAHASITTAPTAKLDTNALNVPNDLNDTNDINDLNVINEHNDINDVNPIASRPSPLAKFDPNDLNDTNDINDLNHLNDLNVLNQIDQKNHSSVAHASTTTAPNLLNAPNDHNDLNALNIFNPSNPINQTDVLNDLNALNDLNDTNDTNDLNHLNGYFVQLTPPSLLASEEEVKHFFAIYRGRYNRKDIDAFLSLFSPRAVQNQRDGFDEIKKIYSDFFDQSEKLRYHIKDMKIEIFQNAVEVRARYEIDQTLKKREKKKVWKGEIRWILVKENRALKIRFLDYKPYKTQ